jgi:TPR repeat protein
VRHAPSPAEAAAYIARARAKIQLGDIAAARRLLERASQSDEGEAFFALAETYDPRMLAKWGVLGTKPDREIAKALYNNAASRGAQGAKERLLAFGE